MNAGGWLLAAVVVVTIAIVVFLVGATVRSIQVSRSPRRSLWREFGLSLVLMVLFFASWIAHGVSEWQVYTDEQRTHGESTDVGDFLAEFGQSTLENWQSEFLQLFSFVVLSAVYIHKGSAESKDGDEKLEASLRRIEEHLGTLPPPDPSDEDWELPDTPLDSRAR
jgi:hypothetical protein